MRQLGFITLLACSVVAPAGAHDFCVDSSAAIQGALTAAQANGEDDTILIRTGHYLLDTDLSAGLTFSSSEAHSLTLIGGLDDAQCLGTVDLAGPGSVLDGEVAVRPLIVSNAGGAVSITALTFANGFVAGTGGGLNVGAGAVTIALSRFYLNHATGANAQGGGIFAVALAGPVALHNNLIWYNRATKVGGAALYQADATNGDGSVQLNTITANTTDTLAEPGGLRLTGGGAPCVANFGVDNNIIWNNHVAGGSDFGVFCPHTRNTNDIGVVTPGSTNIGFTSDLSVDPQFVACGTCGNLELAWKSPLVDAGTSNVTLHGFDLAGKFREQGLQVDIGAFENDVIFADGFQ